MTCATSLMDQKNTEMPSTANEKDVLAVASEDKFKPLDPKYCISYGNNQAPYTIVEYFSFQCPHCIKLFRSDFEKIKTKLIDTGKVRFTYHPVPQDLATLQAMICFEKLTEAEKRLFLEVLFEEAVPEDPDLMAKLMMKAMKSLKSR